MAISYDSVEILSRFAKQRKISFPLLSDQGSRTIDAFGIRNTGNKNGIPHPGTFLVDKKGIIRARYFHDSFRTRHTSAEILEGLKKLKD